MHSRCYIINDHLSYTVLFDLKTFWFVLSWKDPVRLGVDCGCLSPPPWQVTGYWQLKLGDFGRTRYNSKGKRITSTYDEIAMAYSPPEVLLQVQSLETT